MGFGLLGISYLLNGNNGNVMMIDGYGYYLNSNKSSSQFTVLPLETLEDVQPRCAAPVIHASISLLSHKIPRKFSVLLGNPRKWGKEEKEKSRYSGT